jgi:hypothetical protein
MLDRMPLRDTVRRSFEELSNCNAVEGERCGEGSDRASMGARDWARRSIKSRKRAGRTGLSRRDLDRRAKWRFQVASWRRRQQPPYWLHGVKVFSAASGTRHQALSRPDLQSNDNGRRVVPAQMAPWPLRIRRDCSICYGSS